MDAAGEYTLWLRDHLPDYAGAVPDCDTDPAEKEDAVAAVHTGGWNGDQGIPAGGLPGIGGAFLRYST